MSTQLRLGVGALCLSLLSSVAARGAEQGLIGHWTMRGDSQDHSGNGHHATARYVDLSQGVFDGKRSFAEVASAPLLNLGTSNFTIATWINTERELRDFIGDIVTKFDPATRRGFQLTVNAANPGYNGQSNARHLFFGIDNADAGRWIDCGRPSAVAHSCDALTVFNGDLYAGTTDGPAEEDWAHVYRYRGGQEWDDCGRLGTGRTRGVYAMVVHDGALYAATSASHGPQPATMSFGRVYRYAGGKTWDDVGQPGENHRLNALASFRGKLYAAGFNIGPKVGYCYEYQGDRMWKLCGEFAGWPHTLAVHDDRLHAAYPNGEVHAYDGQAWENLGNPYLSTKVCSQIHSLGVYRGELYAGTWPGGKIAVLRGGRWIDLGRTGDATETVGLTVYNGCLYAATIPRAEVFRFDGPDQWTSVRRLFDPPGYEPVPVGGSGSGVSDWSRASSLAVFQGKLFASTATCYRTNITAPPADDPRGKVFSFQSGAAVSLDRDLGSGWHHLTAVRRSKSLELYVDGRLASETKSSGEVLDVSTDSPLLIGFGPQAHFRGAIRDVRLYSRALEPHEIQASGQLPRSE